MRMESSELRAFIAVIEQNGFNRAADILHVTQSAVSQSVANLETKLDSRLIERGKQLKLTETGKRLFDYAHATLREEQQTLEDIERIKKGDSATLSLAINSTINRFYAPRLLNLYCQQHPHTRLHIEELPSRSIIYAVLSGKAELGIGPFQKHMSAHTTLPLFKETRHLVISPNHPLSQQIISGDTKVLKRTPLITSFLDEPEMRPAIQRIRDQFATVWEISSLRLRMHLVDQGLGIAYIDSKLLREGGIYYKTGKKPGACAQQFIAVCQAFWQTV